MTDLKPDSALLHTQITAASQPTRRSLPKAPEAGTSLEEAKRVAKDFESVFLEQMISTMFKDVKSSVMSGGFGEKVWREHLFGEYAKVMAEGGGIGVADQIVRQIATINGVGANGYVSEDELAAALGPSTRQAPGATSIGVGAQIGRTATDAPLPLVPNRQGQVGQAARSMPVEARAVAPAPHGPAVNAAPSVSVSQEPVSQSPVMQGSAPHAPVTLASVADVRPWADGTDTTLPALPPRAYVASIQDLVTAEHAMPETAAGRTGAAQIAAGDPSDRGPGRKAADKGARSPSQLPRATEVNARNVIAAQVQAYGRLTPDQVALERELLAEIAAGSRRVAAAGLHEGARHDGARKQTASVSGAQEARGPGTVGVK